MGGPAGSISETLPLPQFVGELGLIGIGLQTDLSHQRQSEGPTAESAVCRCAPVEHWSKFASMLERDKQARACLDFKSPRSLPG